MEYVQMTLNDWVQMKQKLKQELLGVKQSFVRIGYALRKIEDQRLYEQDGYKSIAEFAKAEYGLEPSTTSRFMSINREYSVDGYSETLRPEFADLGRSQLEEMLKLPDSDRQMIQPETSREDIRELKRFNKTEPAAGVADDISQLVEKFYKDNPDVFNEVFSEPAFEEQTINRFTEIVNPAGNRSYKKGLYFMMMYENRVTFKKFGDTPKDMTWWEFYQLTREIFDDTAAGTKTWQNHFGGADDEESTVQDTADEPGREENATETPKPEDDSGAVGETGADDVQEIEKGGMEDHGAADEAGTGQEEDDTDGEESGQADCEEPAERTDEQTGAQSQGEEIAPAQKSAEILESEASDEAENGENCGAAETGTTEPVQAEVIEEEEENEESMDGTADAAENEPAAEENGEEKAERVALAEKHQTRKEYIDRLSEKGFAEYLAEEYQNHSFKVTYLMFVGDLFEWLSQKVDEFGKAVEDAR